MPQGLEVFNANGSTRIGITTKLCRVLGSVNVSGKGSMAFPYSVQGTKSVSLVSNQPLTDNFTTPAWAYLDGNTVYYDQTDDRQPITLLFMAW